MQSLLERAKLALAAAWRRYVAALQRSDVESAICWAVTGMVVFIVAWPILSRALSVWR